jgi:RNA polymerase sigma-70 factor (ECF subfamily)
MALIVKGKEKAFNELYERYSKKFFLFFYQKLNRNSDRAEDLLQDLFLKIIDNAETFDRSKKFSSWAYSIAFNMCKNEYRNNTYKSFKFERLNEDFSPKIEQSNYLLEDDESNALFKKCLVIELKKLDEKHSLTFSLRHLNNLSIKEISDIMECSEGTVKSRLFYASKKISKNLKRFNPNKI